MRYCNFENEFSILENANKFIILDLNSHIETIERGGFWQLWTTWFSFLKVCKEVSGFPRHRDFSFFFEHFSNCGISRKSREFLIPQVFFEFLLLTFRKNPIWLFLMLSRMFFRYVKFGEVALRPPPIVRRSQRGSNVSTWVLTQIGKSPKFPRSPAGIFEYVVFSREIIGVHKIENIFAWKKYQVCGCLFRLALRFFQDFCPIYSYFDKII